MATSWEELELTRDEMKNLGNALKNEDFRKLLVEYAEEVNDPKNVAIFQEEMTLLEKERGVDITFINPEPGYVVKTSVDGQKKAFINICKNENIAKPSCTKDSQSGTSGHTWYLPYSQAPPREDIDKSGVRCVVYDVVFHPQTFKLAENNRNFRNMLTDTALDAVEKTYSVKLDRKNIKFPKLKFKGMKRAAVIRHQSDKPPNRQDDVLEKIFANRPINTEKNNDIQEMELETNERNAVNDTSYATPKYKIVHRDTVDLKNYTNDKLANVSIMIPKELVVEVHLPLLNSSENISLDVTEKRLVMVSEKSAKYKLDLVLPYLVHENMGTAHFDKSARTLNIKLPVRQGQASVGVADLCRDDSGVESDAGCRSSESSNGDDDTEEKRKGVSDFSRSDSVISDISPDEEYRTSKKHSFLSTDICYSLPSFTCNVVDNVLCFTLHVKNVNPSSVEHTFLEKKCGVHIKFTSVGSGFFPINHAFCVELLANCSLLKDEFSIETWDNNVILQLVIAECDSALTDYYAGLTEDALMKFSLPEPAALHVKQDKILKEAEFETCDEDELKVDIKKHSKEEVVIEISSQNSEVFVETMPPAQESEEAKLEKNQDEYIEDYLKTTQEKYRSYSESSGDEMCLSPAKRGILKNSRVFRSLSESSMDDYGWSSSVDMVTQSGSESCIPEETEDEEKGCKKTVRFNDVVSRKTFRANSSILGQKKKNQRKARNKKRAHDRRASESENSECEVEKEQGMGAKTEEEDNIEDVSEVESSGADNPSSKNVSDNIKPVDVKDESKTCRKNKNSQGVDIDFVSDLLFDLDI